MSIILVYFLKFVGEGGQRAKSTFIREGVPINVSIVGFRWMIVGWILFDWMKYVLNPCHLLNSVELTQLDA